MAKITSANSCRERESPISRLPLELLTEVFLHVARGDPGGFSFPQFKLCPPSIMKISKQWRNIANSTPQLFTKLSFDFPYHFPLGDSECSGQPDQDQLRWCLGDGLKRWITASGNFPLDIELQLDTNCQICSRDIIVPAWNVLFEQFSRWRSLYLNALALPSVWNIVSNAKGIAEQLEEVVLIPYWRQSPEATQSPDALSVANHCSSLHCPRLKKLTINVCDRMNWEEVPELISFLSRLNAPALVHLDLHSTAELDGSLFRIINANFASIRHLAISANIDTSSLSDGNVPLNRLHLPQLTDCDITMDFYPFRLFNPSLLAECHNLIRLDISCHLFAHLDNSCFLEMHFRSLKSLRLEFSHGDNTSETLHQFMQCLPALEDLTLVVTWNTDLNGFLDALLIGMACPLLGALLIMRGYADRGKLVDLMSNRSADTESRRKLLLTLCSCAKLPDVEALDADAFQIALRHHDNGDLTH